MSRINLWILVVALVGGLALWGCEKGGSDEASGEESAEATEEGAEGGEAAEEGSEAEQGGEAAETEATGEPTSQPTPTPTATAPAEGGMEGMDHVLREGQYDPALLVSQPGAAVGDLVQCPVSGDAFEVTAEAPHVAHAGQEIYFCCPSCIRAFQRNPERFLEN